MKIAEATGFLIKAIGVASISVKEFESSMKGMSRAMAKIQPKKLGAHSLGRDVVDHYSKLYARRKTESIQRSVKRQKKEFRKEVIKKKLTEKKSIPKKLRDKLISEVESVVPDAFDSLALQSSSKKSIHGWHHQVIIPPEREHPIRVKEIKIANLFKKEDVDKPVPDVLNQKIVDEAKKILRRNPKLKESHINSEEFKRLVAEEIEREISKEEQRDLQEKVILRRRRKVIRKKQ